MFYGRIGWHGHYPRRAVPQVGDAQGAAVKYNSDDIHSRPAAGTTLGAAGILLLIELPEQLGNPFRDFLA